MKSPKAPDPTATTNAQAKYNLETAQKTQNMNMVNQSTPYGSLNYSVSGYRSDGTPIYTASQTLSPEQQALYNSRTGAQQSIADTASNLATNMADTYSKPMNVDSETMTRLYNLGAERLDPLYAQKAEKLESDLINRGIRPGTEAYDRAKLSLAQAENDARNQLILSGYSTAQNAALSERNQGLSDLNALLGNSQVTAPNYINTPTANVQGVDYSGMVQNNYNQKVAQNNAMIGGLSSMAGMALGGLATGGIAPLAGLALGGAGSSLGGWGSR